jgi:GNAT superfamily N-acetyltransferase
VELRPTTPDDLPELHSVFSDAVRSVFQPHGFDAPAPSLEAFANLQEHVRVTGTSMVAVDDSRVVGFGSAWTRDDHWFLASLFVSPTAQGRGVGPALLDAVWGDAGHRLTITDSIQPVSNVLYGRRGLIPATPVLTFTGVPAIDAGGVESEADLAAIDRAAYGFDRAVDHRLWASVARRTTWGDAYSYVFPNGDIGPVAGLTEEAAAEALASELARTTGPIRVRVLGSARTLVEVALRARLRLGPVPGFLLVSRGLEAPRALAPSGYLLY